MLLEVSCPLPKSPPESSTAFGGGWKSQSIGPGCRAHQLPGEGRWCLFGEQTRVHTLCTPCLRADHSTHPWGLALQCGSPGCLCTPGHSEMLVDTWILSPLSSSSSSQPPTGQVVFPQRPLGNLSKVRSSRRSQAGFCPGSGYTLTAAPGRRGGGGPG